MYGYMGRLLRVDLSSGKVRMEKIPEAYQRDFIGGSGLGIRLAYDEIPSGADPLGPENSLYFMTGPLTGTMLGTAGRIQLVYKSPLTGILCDCSSGGFWGAALKQAGYDGLVVEGVSAKPVYLFIDGETVDLRDAAAHWGKDTYQVQEDLKAEMVDSKARVAAIGVAGERGVLISCIINDDGRALARGGNGAVMGAKRLKAIVVRGSQETQLADPDAFRQIAAEINKKNATDPDLADLRKYGTSSCLDGRWAISDIPVKNWSVGSSEAQCTPVGGKEILKRMPNKHAACYRCTIGCARWVKIESGPYKMDGPGPEYESVGALGPLCLVKDLEAVSYANHLCNLYGLDTISAGASIAFGMECWEKGLITAKQTDGIELKWASGDAVVAMVHKIGQAEGAGQFFGQGTKRMAKEIGGGSEAFAVHVKGMELPMHDARAGFAWAVNYATGSRGGCHLHGMSDLYEESTDPMPEWNFMGKFTRLSNEGKAEMARFAQNWAHLLDSLVMCYFATVLLKPGHFCRLLNAATGADYTPEELLKIGDRINALHRAYNCRCGVRAADDTLPVRAMTPLAEGGAAGRVPDLAGQLRRYYALRGWEPDGRPGRKILAELGLQKVVRDLYPS